MGLLWIVLVAGAVWWIATQPRGGPSLRRRDSSALDILEERYARGEIGREEYEQKRQDLAESADARAHAMPFAQIG